MYERSNPAYDPRAIMCSVQISGVLVTALTWHVNQAMPSFFMSAIQSKMSSRVSRRRIFPMYRVGPAKGFKIAWVAVMNRGVLLPRGKGVAADRAHGGV